MRVQSVKNMLIAFVLSSIVLYANQPSFDKVLSLEGISFHVTTTGEGSLQQLSITVKGLEGGNSVMQEEIDGDVIHMEVADINADGSPELYLSVLSAGSGSYISLIAYSVNNKKSMTSIYLRPLAEEDKNSSIGYMGHDTFKIVDNRLVRHFPIYLKEDANCCPTGGTRELEYALTQGEASWLFKLVKSTDLANKVDVLIALAKSKIGDGYIYGKTGPDHFDCSGFVYYLFKESGNPIPRTSLEQSKNGDKLTRKALKKGDMIFFDTHERGHVNHSGVYLGDGKFIHASSGKAMAVTISELDKGFYVDKFRWGIRKLP